jgi:hypothetical protein
MRVAIVAETLRHMGFGDDADRLRSSWHTEFDAPLHNAEFDADIAPIARAILDGPYPTLAKGDDARLTGVLTFRRDALGGAIDTTLAEGVRGKGVITHGSAPELVAAARSLFSKAPDEYEAKDYATKICGFIDQFAPKGTRGTAAVNLKAVAAADEAAGASGGL